MKKSIRTHFALLFALLALAPIAIIFAIYSPGVIRELNTMAAQDLQPLIRSHVNITSLWIEEKVLDVERLADSQCVIDGLKGHSQGPESLSSILDSNLKGQGILGIYVFDSAGKLKASSRKGEHAGGPPENVTAPAIEGTDGISFRWTTLSEQALSEQEGTGGERLKLSLTTPVREGADLLGIIVVETSVAQMKNVLVDLTGKRHACRLLIDKEGRIITCFAPDPSCKYNEVVGKRLVNPGTGAVLPVVSACLSGQEGFTTQAYTNSLGERVVGAWGWVPELNAGLILEIEEHEFFGQVTMVRNRLWTLLLIVGVGLVVVSIVMGRMVSEPLISISRTAKRIAAGNFDERSTISSDDELGELAESLNSMVESLRGEHAELEEAHRELVASAVRDGLTGLYNHYRFQQNMESEYSRAKRYNLPLCLLMIDIDNFKLINDTYGHPFGDFILKELAQLIGKSTRETDIASRYGGEEFVVILPSTALDGGYAVAEKLRQATESRLFKQGGQATRLTVTIGISSLAEEDINSKDDMIKHADEAMYEGKIKGKNMTLSWGEFMLLERLALKEEGESVEHYRNRFLTAASSMKRAYMEAATTLVKTLEEKDGFSATHSFMVAIYATKFAEEMGLSKEETAVIKNSATLHDIGKIAISSSILRKADKLTAKEHDTLKTHAEHGLKILEGVDFLQQELPIILHHQERFNGEGYPNGVKGEAIPLGSRILAICDAYESMTSERPYRKRISHKAAIEEIRKCSGTQFDPDLVQPFIRAMERLISTTESIYIPQLNKTVEIR
ncbi:MAG: diguanylate cyclase [Planctomycetes bacterium]|nr:diguanylate cyclase [Planctomycetota bacterium]